MDIRVVIGRVMEHAGSVTDWDDKTPTLIPVGAETGDDTILATTDGQTLNIAYVTPAPSTTGLDPSRCQAITQAGAQCQRRPSTGTAFLLAARRPRIAEAEEYRKTIALRHKLEEEAQIPIAVAAVQDAKARFERRKAAWQSDGQA